jgi:hypothetical protein
MSRTQVSFSSAVMTFKKRCTFGHHIIIHSLLEESSQFLNGWRVRQQTFPYPYVKL